MSDNTNFIEEDGVIIKQEHAYASKDDTTIDNYDNSDDDPLKIMPCDVDKIKSENVEIKVEPDLDQDEEIHKDMNTSIEYNEDLNGMDQDSIEPVTNPVSVLNMNFSGDFVPKSAFMDLLNKYSVINTLISFS